MGSQIQVESSLATTHIGVAETETLTVDKAIDAEGGVPSYDKKAHDQKTLTTVTMQGPGQSQLANSNEGQTELVEYDVTVCDICGDKGREDKLAICSNCSDGAEHIYCMKVMLDKVPEGNWMCEDCTLQQVSLNAIQYKLNRPIRISRLRREHMRFGISGFSKGTDGSKLKLMRPSHLQKTRADIVSPTLHLPAVKRHAWTPEMKQVKTTNSKANSISPSSFNLHQKSLFRSDSPSSLGKRKLRAACQSGKSLEVSKVKIGSPSRPKQLDVEAIVKVHPETEIRSIGADIGHEIQMSSQLEKHTPAKTLEQMKTIKRKIIICEDGSLSDRKRNNKIPSSSCQPKSGNLLGTFSESNRRAFPETRPLSFSRDPSMNNLDEGKMKVDQVGSLSKEEFVGSALARKLLPPSPSQRPQKLESESFVLRKSESFHMVNSPENQELSSNAVFRRLKSDGSFVSNKNGTDNSLKMMRKSLPYHKPTSSESKLRSSDALRTYGHENEIETTRLHAQSELSNSVLQSPVSVSAPITTHAEKNQNKIRALQLSENFHGESPTSNKFVVPEVLGKLNTPTEPGSPFVAEEICCENKQPNRNSLTEHDMGTNSVSYARIDLSHLKPLKEEILSYGGAIPFPYYIWIGSFELLHRDGLQSTCDGVAGYLSSQASPKVAEVVDFIPKCLTLEIAPRLEIWPPQFNERPPIEYDIALFYFADSWISYQRNYRPLLDLMIKDDLALRGNFNGFELLIFPSNILPKQSQSWNAMYYLWGVFRGKKAPPTTDIPANNFEREDAERNELPSSVIDPVVSENRPDQETQRTAETNIDDQNPDHIKNCTMIHQSLDRGGHSSPAD